MFQFIGVRHPTGDKCLTFRHLVSAISREKKCGSRDSYRDPKEETCLSVACSKLEEPEVSTRLFQTPREAEKLRWPLARLGSGLWLARSRQRQHVSIDSIHIDSDDEEENNDESTFEKEKEGRRCTTNKEKVKESIL